MKAHPAFPYAVLFVLLLSSEAVDGSPTRSNSTPIYKGVMYEFEEDLDMSFSKAEQHCEENGGHLAKLTGSLLQDKSVGGLSDILASYFLPHTDVWIGLSDRDREGQWRWLDGSKASTVRWRKLNFIVKLMESWHYDCGVIKLLQHNTGHSWEWGQLDCSVKRPFLCQYDILKSKTTTDATAATTTLFSTSTKRQKKKPKPVRPVNRHRKRTVVRKIRDGFQVFGSPMLDKSTSTVTMCSRLCFNKCHYFNFNAATRQCRGFSSVSELFPGKPEGNWDLWIVT